MSGWMTVALKELRDHRRDRRSLVSAALYSLMGPIVILLVAQSPLATTGGAPLLLSMMTVFALVAAFTGGMFIALDATAGERERGSWSRYCSIPFRHCTWSAASGAIHGAAGRARRAVDRDAAAGGRRDVVSTAAAARVEESS